MYSCSDQNGAKTLPFGAAYTYMAYIREYPPPPQGPRPSCKYYNLGVMFLFLYLVLRQLKSDSYLWYEIGSLVCVSYKENAND